MKLKHGKKVLNGMVPEHDITFITVYHEEGPQVLTLSVNQNQVQTIMTNFCTVDHAIEMLTYAKEQM